MTTISIGRPERAVHTFGWWARRTALAGAAILATGVLGFGAVAVGARLKLAGEHPPPGQLVDVGGYRMHIDCIGEGGPTVLLEAGNADFSVHWSAVQPQVAAFARVCAYDRAGLGWSDPGPNPRTAAAMVGELEALLDAARIDGPLVLVGHSFGAVTMRLFAQQHPDRVAGLVLVDPAHEQQVERIPAMRAALAEGVAQFEGLQPLATFGLIALAPGNVPNRGLPAEAHARYTAVLATTGYFAAAAAETAALAANLEYAGTVRESLGNLPLVVISRGRTDLPAGVPADEAARLEAEWMAMQRDLLTLSTQSRHVIAAESGHYVQLQQPDLVVEAIAGIVGRS